MYVFKRLENGQFLMVLLLNYGHTFYNVEKRQFLVSSSLIRFQMLKWSIIVVYIFSVSTDEQPFATNRLV